MDEGFSGGGATVPSAVRPFRFDALHAEALGLAEAARVYIAARAASPPPADGGDPLAQLVASREATLLVSRVAFCIAWLLARRAAAAGEAEPAGGDAEGGVWRLGGRELCMPHPGPAVAPPLPRPLADLLERSARLYARIDRLDRQLAGPLPARDGTVARGIASG